MRTTFWFWLKLRCGVKEGQVTPRWMLPIKAVLWPVSYVRYLRGRCYIPSARYEPWRDVVTFYNGKTKVEWTLGLLKGDTLAQGIYKFTRRDFGGGNVAWTIERTYLTNEPDKLFVADNPRLPDDSLLAYARGLWTVMKLHGWREGEKSAHRWLDERLETAHDHVRLAKMYFSLLGFVQELQRKMLAEGKTEALVSFASIDELVSELQRATANERTPDAGYRPDGRTTLGPPPQGGSGVPGKEA